jgi:HAD superfamily hydrolase (TIGR01662 family)
VEQKFVALLAEQGIRLDGIYYCYHHPRGTLAELALACDCRKPASGSVRRACVELGIDAAQSWFVGDRDTDVLCGRGAGCRTILVRSGESRKPGWGESAPDFVADNLLDAVNVMGQPS